MAMSGGDHNFYPRCAYIYIWHAVWRSGLLFLKPDVDVERGSGTALMG
jgi:hypothetical protein